MEQDFVPRITVRDEADAKLIDDALFLCGYKLLQLHGRCTATHSDPEECGWFVAAQQAFELSAEVREAGDIAKTLDDIASL